MSMFPKKKSNLHDGARTLTENETHNNNNKKKSIASFGTLSYRGKFAAQPLLFFCKCKQTNSTKPNQIFSSEVTASLSLSYHVLQILSNTWKTSFWINKKFFNLSPKPHHPNPYDSDVKSEKNTREKITTKNQKIFFMSPASVSLNV